ncbi:oxidoreductase [Ectocarpus siliculosus]|uniref:Oxidoreductase n=1 Tax=Ectocarpus siliculosus TaxID=2880 RepID=D8LHS3_ECTSI|nr:oxidoreductase [Ectocarpus siliculosus]|eukprot:CBN74354.1 oxidoreductase [Ectocarpus siliculosus]
MMDPRARHGARSERALAGSLNCMQRQGAGWGGGGGAGPVWRYRVPRQLGRVHGGRASDEEANSPRRSPAATGGETSDGSGKGPSPSQALKALVKKLPEGAAAAKAKKDRSSTPQSGQAEDEGWVDLDYEWANMPFTEALGGGTNPLEFVLDMLPGTRRGISGEELDDAYAMMPHIQESLMEKTGWEGTGTGYEDTPVGFYRDTNLKPLNWRDAMVSMKPGSGTLGLDPHFDDTSGSPEQVERRRERGLLKGVGTRYRGPPPGTHGPWRWGQLVKGSALEEKLKAEIASFPRRLPRRVRRYYHDKVAWVTGADHGLGEQMAINLAVNGARVILSGTSLEELERVQRLCILAWMKAVDWELLDAILEGLTRLDRVMIMPLDVRDTFILDHATRKAEDMLDRPVGMVFHCQGGGVVAGEWDEEDEEGEEEGEGDLDLEASGNLRGAISLTKAVLPSMLDEQEGHLVVLGGDDFFTSREETSSPAGVVSSKHAARGYFDRLRREVSRDGVKVTTLLHHSGCTGSASALQTPSSFGGDPAASRAAIRTATAPAGRAQAPIDTATAARKALVAVSRAETEVSLRRRSLPGLTGLEARVRTLPRRLKRRRS